MSTKPDALKGVEALYNLTKAAFDAEISRYDATEAKAGRYLTVLGLVIGGFVIKFDDLMSVYENTRAPQWASVTFVAIYGVTVFAALLAFGCAFLAMSVKNVLAIPVGEEIEKLFKDHEIEVALSMTTESFRQAARSMRETTEDRMSYLGKANLLLRLSVVAAVASLFFYFPLRISALEAIREREAAKMSQTTNTTQTQTKPADTAKPPRFDVVKRDAGDATRKK